MTLASETPIPVDDSRHGTVETFDSLDPGNGQLLATYPVQSAEEVSEAVARAREAAVLVAGPGLAGPAHPSPRLEGRAGPADA